MRRPIVGLTLFFIVGITLGRYLPFSLLPFYILSLILFGVSLSLFLKRKSRLANLLLFSLTLLVGYLYFSFAYFPHSPTHVINFAPSESGVELVGRVVSRPSEKVFTERKRVSFILEAERIEVERKDRRFLPEAPNINETLHEKVEGRVWINSYSPYRDFGYRDRVSVRGRLRVPQSASRKGEFDWQRYLSYQGVWVELHTGRVKVLEEARFSLVRWAHENEDHLARAIERILPNPHAQVAKSILLGDKDRLPPHILTGFRRTGTAHVLVVSGLHVGLILFILFFVLRTLGVPSKIVSVFAFPVLVYYALLTGLRAPVVRASFMAGVGLTCLLIDRDTPLRVVLSLAAFFVLILNPLSLFTVSFQLSFVAVGGIIYLTPSLEKKLYILPRWVARPLAISLAAQASILPLLAFYFHQLPLIGLLANLLLAPLITIILAFGFLSLALGLLFLPAGQLIANTNWLVISSLVWLVDRLSFSSFPTLSRIACPSVEPFPAIYLLFYYLGLVMVPQVPTILSYVRGKEG